jgi:hypothetical protein
VRWENRAKEVFWRLVYNGLPTPARLHAQGRPCQCGAGEGGGLAALPGRRHCFWDCPVAAAVREEIQRALPPGSLPLARGQLWLARQPEGVHRGVWLVVVLSAVLAMDTGRAALTSWRLVPDPAAPHPAALPPAQQVEAAGRLAAAAFWGGLQDYVGGGDWADCWGEAAVPAPHPFIQRVGSSLSVCLPP